jgi:integrase
MQGKRSQQGIRTRHSRSCAARSGGRCNCQPSYDAWVYDRRRAKKVWKTFPTLAAAKGWRSDALTALRRGRLQPTSSRTLEEAAEAWLEGAKAEPPTILNKSGRPYQPSALEEYERNLRNYVLKEFGDVRLSDLRRSDLQRFVDSLLGTGLSGSKVRNIVIPIQVIYRHAIRRDEVDANPALGLELPNGHKARDRVASAAEAAELLGALPKEDRALWATAFYAGLRRGELRGLQWNDVSLAAGIINVRRGWHDRAGAISPKSVKGTRTVPITALLRDYLTELKAQTGRDGSDFVFGATGDRPFVPWSVRERALKAWKKVNEKRAQAELPALVPIGLHECRHTFVSLMHDAGLSLERIGDYVGHSSAYMTDKYRHLLKGHEDEARKLFDEYLARADTSSRLEQLEGPSEPSA